MMIHLEMFPLEQGYARARMKEPLYFHTTNPGSFKKDACRGSSDEFRAPTKPALSTCPRGQVGAPLLEKTEGVTQRQAGREKEKGAWSQGDRAPLAEPAVGRQAEGRRGDRQRRPDKGGMRGRAEEGGHRGGGCEKRERTTELGRPHYLPLRDSC